MCTQLKLSPRKHKLFEMMQNKTIPNFSIDYIGEMCEREFYFSLGRYCLWSKIGLRMSSNPIHCLSSLLSRMLDSLRKVWMFAPPVIILAGTVGNVLTLITVTSRRCKKNSFVVYLGALAIADTANLYFGFFNVWLLVAFDIDIMLSAVSCKILGFMIHVCAMWSSLLIATLSTDRMLCSCFPLKRDKLCSPKSAMIFTSISLGFVLMIHGHELYGFKLITVENVTFCGYADNSYATFFDVYFTWVDMSIYFVLPTIVIIVANILAVRGVINSAKLKSHLMNVSAVKRRIRNNRQMVVMAVAVSAAFVLLTSPIGIYTIIRPYVFQDSDVFYAHSDIEFLVRTIIFILAYLNYAINFFLYFISGRRYREELKAACCWGRSSRVAPTS